MLIFVEQITERLKYIFNYAFANRLGLNYNFTQNTHEFESAITPKLNYSSITFTNIINIKPENLLFESVIRKNKPTVAEKDKQTIIFPNDSDFGFDIFSACFWMLSRYEEYQHFTPDIHNRFTAKESFAFKNNFIKNPIVDEWIMILRSKLKEYFPQITLKEEHYEFVPTFDVDSPWCYKNKGFARFSAGFVRDLLKTNTESLKLRANTLFQNKLDPWFQFEFVNQVLTEANVSATYFVHTGSYGKYDKTVSFKKKQFKKFVNELAHNHNVGLHPSYKASTEPKIFLAEKKRLEQMSNKKITISRQHYLKISIPKYYEMLNNAGIEQDYTMGFSDLAGFRAGTSRPFTFYNLQKETSSNVIIHPFCIMDRTLKTYQNLSKEQVLEMFNEFTLNLKRVNGKFVSLWHNESLSNVFEWKGWKQIFYKAIIQSAN